METFEFFRKLYAYNYDCIQKYIIVLEINDIKKSNHILKLFSHIVNAHHIWNNRMLSKSNLYKVWQNHTIEQIKSISQDNFDNSMKIIELLENNSSNKYPVEKMELDVLFHIINHSTYHIGQIAYHLKNENIQPISTDYIFYINNLR